MLREIALYETRREEWAQTETRLHLERQALAARPLATPAVALGRMARRLTGLAQSERKLQRPSTHSAPLAS